ncbi:hypothetical protein [Methylobacterium nigriterrae]|uniref:hypothetical protein n=1 Tax=Methylobacterium nigriterrae TaxID=3127512 RepID=UPI003013B3F6
MEDLIAAPLLEALAFVLGCVLIHANRRQPDRVTGMLMLIGFAVVILFALAWAQDQGVFAQQTGDRGGVLLASTA